MQNQRTAVTASYPVNKVELKSLANIELRVDVWEQDKIEFRALGLKRELDALSVESRNGVLCITGTGGDDETVVLGDPMTIELKVPKETEITALFIARSKLAIGDTDGKVTISGLAITGEIGKVREVDLRIYGLSTLSVEQVMGETIAVKISEGNIRINSGRVIILTVAIEKSGNFVYAGEAHSAVYSATGEAKIRVKKVASKPLVIPIGDAKGVEIVTTNWQ